MNKPKIIVVLGPTATGKSDLAVYIAKKLNGEVISADSRQVYSELNLGTGKITKEEMGGVRHHLLDVVDPKKQFSVSEYAKLGQETLEDILSREKLPIVCGGTGFYIDALVNSSKLPNVPPDKKLRKNLEGRSAAELYTILTWMDKNRAATIDAENPRRLIRAIEIAKHLGSVPNIEPGESRYEVLKIGLTLPPEELRAKIRARILARMKKGMLREARNLRKNGLSWKRMDELGLEYRYLARHLQGKMTEKEMVAKLETEIWRYAKRQMTWFKKDASTKWISPLEKQKGLLLVKEFLH